MSDDYAKVERCIHYLERNLPRQPSLAELADAVHSSPWHLQRLFRRWAGVSPKRFLACLTVAHAKELLASSSTLLEASLELGLSGPARLHDHFVSLEAVTPGQYQRGGLGLDVDYGVHPSPFGDMLVATTARGVCGLAFCASRGPAAELERLAALWPRARLRERSSVTAPIARRVFAGAARPEQPLTLLVRGTNFQVQVWRALLRVPGGRAVSYAQLARAAGAPGAARAAGSALTANPIGYLIPCHRVLRASGAVGEYRWGASRKRVMLAWESARSG